jgi:hypothetical protein
VIDGDRSHRTDPAQPLVAAVIAFVAKQLSVPPNRIHQNTRIERDLHCTGDDAAELMEAFARQFSADLSEFQIDRHFGPEGWPISSTLRHLLLESSLGPPTEDVTIARMVEVAQHGHWVASNRAAT